MKLQDEIEFIYNLPDYMSNQVINNMYNIYYNKLDILKYQNHKFFLQFMKIGEVRKSIMDEEVLVVDKIYII